MDSLINDIKGYLKIINPKLDEIEKKYNGLIDFVINEVLDRVQLYLNCETIPNKLGKVIARVVNTGLTKSVKEITVLSSDDTAIDQVVTSISDNGQSISIANEITKYFTSATDEELFSGFTSLLSRYRRINVVYPKCDETENS